MNQFYRYEDTIFYFITNISLIISLGQTYLNFLERVRKDRFFLTEKIHKINE